MPHDNTHSLILTPPPPRKNTMVISLVLSVLLKYNTKVDIYMYATILFNYQGILGMAIDYNHSFTQTVGSTYSQLC